MMSETVQEPSWVGACATGEGFGGMVESSDDDSEPLSVVAVRKDTVSKYQDEKGNEGGVDEKGGHGHTKSGKDCWEF